MQEGDETCKRNITKIDEVLQKITTVYEENLKSADSIYSSILEEVQHIAEVKKNEHKNL